MQNIDKQLKEQQSSGNPNPFNCANSCQSVLLEEKKFVKIRVIRGREKLVKFVQFVDEKN